VLGQGWYRYEAWHVQDLSVDDSYCSHGMVKSDSYQSLAQGNLPPYSTVAAEILLRVHCSCPTMKTDAPCTTETLYPHATTTRCHNIHYAYQTDFISLKL
jgi:hypothetical protein